MGKLLLPLLAAFLSLGVLLAGAQAAQAPLYIALGDSLAFGVGASDPPSKGYVGLTFDALRKSDHYRQSGLELLNLSVPGATSSDLLVPGGQLESALKEIDLRQADASSPGDGVAIISIDIGGNDLLALGASDSPCVTDPLGEPCRQRFVQMLDGLKTNLTEAVRRLREAAPNADIIIVGLYNPYSGTGGSLEVPAELAVQQVNGVLNAVAADPAMRAEMAPVFDFFAGRSRQWIAADGLHPNDRGHAVIAEALLAAIEGRPPEIAQDETSVSPAASPVLQPAGESSSNSGPNLLLVLAIAVPAAFAGGAAVTGAYLLARGRS
ncbi:MAG: hypothetical protein HYY03_04570 [Chloroflexi bacterium]|nr:hypothetical protein [Chloroflexota bacterium]